ncbi:MAG: Rne/Rng family ribonuclease [Actinomycetota bacterium]|nr:Rne/Rng family ribonuclease [Actinomycetota bacterium]
MASDDHTTETTSDTVHTTAPQGSGPSSEGQVPEPLAPPAKKAARKRAPRRISDSPGGTAGDDTDAETLTPATDEGGAGSSEPGATRATRAAKGAVPAKKAAAKRAPRKKATAAQASADGAEARIAGAPAGGSRVDEETGEAQVSPRASSGTGVSDTDAAPSFAPVFQAPAPRRRRSSSPAAAPASPTDEPRQDLEAVRLPGGGPVDAEVEEHDSQDTQSESEASADGPRRRRRRGGKGRRGRSTGDGEDAGVSSGDQDDDSAAETAGGSPTTADDGGDGDSSTRRRTRRRRRGGVADDSDAAETAGVTTKVRESRRDEVTALKGSTRLEAKKQRRREGREAGRRRTVITEAEFLARRESVQRVMVVRQVGDRTQIGVLEDGVLVEHYISRETTVSMAGNIYLGRVQNVVPSMEAAFVDIGKGRNAVLYAGEVNWDAAGMEANQPRRIEHALSSGEAVLVQVTKDPIGHKGARLTSQISLPGRYLVYVPNSSMTGISRKLPDTERTRLKRILKEVGPESAGVIVRTAAEGASEDELRADVQRLTSTWEQIEALAESASGGSGSGKKPKKGTAGAPLLLHGEPDLTVRVIRDIFNEDFASLVVAGEQPWQEVSEYVSSVAPDLADRVTRWTSEEDLFTHYRVDEQIAKAMDRKVWLPSGGSLVIDRTEAMTVVDVNTGKFIGSGGNLEETVTKNNIEAAEEIVRQLRLRDIGGIIVIDFIDMVLESNRDLVVRRLLECLGRDRTKHQVAEVTTLGLVQMTRKRVGSGLIEVFSETCEHCNGRGIIVHSDPVDKSLGAPELGSAADAANGSGARSSTPRRSRSRTPEPVASERPDGPTPAQIAAAAHAAAMKTAVYAGESPDPDDALGEDETLLSGELSLVDDGGTDDAADDVTDDVMGDSTDDAVGDFIGDVVGEPIDVEYVSISDSSALSEAAQPSEPAIAPGVAPPIGRGRRRRGRVVAPAGPPRVALGHDGGSATAG